MSWAGCPGCTVASLMASEESSETEGPDDPGRRRLLVSVVVVTVLGFASGAGIAWLTSGSDDGVTVAAPEVSTSTTEPVTSTTASTTSTTSAPSTTGSSTTVESTTSTVPTTTTEPAPTSTSSSVTSTAAPPVVTTSTTLPEPWPVPTSVPSSPPGTPAVLRVAYPGQAQGLLRVQLGQDSQMVVSNAGGTEVRWTAVAAGGIAIGGQQRVEVVLTPGQSAALPLRTHQAGSASITVTSPTQVLVVPVQIT